MSESQSRLAIIIDSTGAEKNVDNLASALNRMTKEGESAASGARKVALAVGDEREALSDLLGQINPVIGALNKLDKQQSKLDEFHKKGLLPTDEYKEYSSMVDLTRSKLTGFGDQLNKIGMSAKQTAAAMRMVPAQMTDIIVSLQGGQAPLTVLLQQGGQLKDMFGGIGPAAKALGTYVGGLVSPFTLAAAAVGVLGLAYYQGSEEQDEFNKSLVLTGNLIGKTSGQLSEIASRVSSVTGSTTGAAASVLNQLVSSGKVAGDELERITAAIVQTSKATGIATDDLLKDFNTISSDPVAAISKLNDQYHFLTVATYNQIKALQEEGNQQDAARLAADTYASTMQQRAADITANLGTLERAWNSLGNSAKGAWDAMLNVGRESTLQDQLNTLNENIAEAEKQQSEGGIWNRFKANASGLDLDDMRRQRDALQSQITTESTLNGVISDHNNKEQKLLKTQQQADAVNKQYLTNSQKRIDAIKQQDKFLQAGVISADQYAQNVSRINDMYKDPKAPKAKKGAAYTEDAGTRMLDQINQQTASLTEQLQTTDKLSEVTKQRIKFEQQIADIKTKSQLTADQKSLLANADAIEQALRRKELIQSQVTTLDDYRKMQEQVKQKDVQTNDLLIERLKLLDKAKSAGATDTDATRANVLRTTKASLPSSVTSVTGGLSPTGGQLSGTWDGLQAQTKQLQQAQTALDQWQQQQLQSYQSYYQNRSDLTAEYEQQIAAVRQQYQDQSTAIRSQQNTIQVAATQSIMDSMVSITRDGFGEQSAIYKAAFIANKAYAIAQATISINQGIAMAAANPYPYNLVAMASVAAATASIVSNLASVSSVGFEKGGYTGGMGTKSVAGVVHGQEYVFDAAATRRIGVSNLEAIRNGNLDATLSKPGFGTGNSNVTGGTQDNRVYNIQAAPITVNGNPDDRTLLLIERSQEKAIEASYRKITNDLTNATGKVSKGLNTGWNIKARNS